MVYHVIVNPAGASGKTGKEWKKLEPLFRESGREYEVHYSTREHGIGEICRELEGAFAARQAETAPTDGAGQEAGEDPFDDAGRETGTDAVRGTAAGQETVQTSEKLVLITVGGDGSVNEAMNGITDPSRILFGHIPAGSGNDLVRDMDLPKDPAQVAGRILEGKVRRRFDIGELEYADTGQKRRFAVSCGIGFDAGICEMAGRSRYKDALNKIGLGQLIYIVSAFRIVSSQKSDSVEIILDGGMHTQPQGADSVSTQKAQGSDSRSDQEVRGAASASGLETLREGPVSERGSQSEVSVAGQGSQSAGSVSSSEENGRGGQVFRYDHLLLLACMNHRFEGGGFQFAPDAVYDDGVLNLCVADPARNSAFYKIFPFAPSGRHLRFKEVHMLSGRTIEVITRIPLWVHTDGEVERKATHIRIRTLPQQLDVLE